MTTRVPSTTRVTRRANFNYDRELAAEIAAFKEKYGITVDAVAWRTLAKLGLRNVNEAAHLFPRLAFREGYLAGWAKLTEIVRKTLATVE